MPRGGRRPGAGRKPKPRPSATVLAHPSVPMLPTTNGPAEVEEFDAPDSLGQPERAVWMKQAPFAFRAGTLTRGTAMSFERYCRMVVVEVALPQGSADHRGILRQINAYELQFLLTPCGKAIARPAMEKPAAVEPQSRLARFRK